MHGTQNSSTGACSMPFSVSSERKASMHCILALPQPFSAKLRMAPSRLECTTRSRGSRVPDPRNETLTINVLCGITAGIVSSAIANPTDVLKVRLQAQGTSRDNMLYAFLNIYRTEGLPGLWRGVFPTAQRAATVAGVELPAYDICKKQIIHSGYLGDTKTTHFLASFLAGLAGAIASNPIDVVKTRLMNQKRLKTAVIGDGITPAIYTSTSHCFVQTVKTEGFMALYKGFVPTWVRLGPWNIIFFMTYEHLKKSY
ncbi:kidney mitochondrial carrier protein 1-like isoform X1 [Haliotis rubra]|uniref:kidney mitochondrial carrier protein 1-like isoform X1 n=1 Tax=Haliotis rubra TaxID=36100 RepID=UPI001EE592D9|nr:kidney mitochondrial carrier protein 1-like isoform X1 [Haliotis rubra]